MLIMYDFDGTLIDSTKAIYEAFCVAFDKELDINLCKSQIGLPLEKIMKNLGVKDEDVRVIISEYKKHYSKIYLDKTYLLDTAKESILLAKNHGDIVLVTTKTSEYSKKLLEHFGLYEYFSGIVGRDDVVLPKPDKEPILKAMQIVGAKAEHSYMIGDTEYDLKAAKNAGVIGIGSLYEYQSKDELLKYSEYVCDNTLQATKKAIELQTNEI